MSLLKRVAMISALVIVSSFAMEDPQGGGGDALKLPPVELVREAHKSKNLEALLEGRYNLEISSYPREYWAKVPLRERGPLKQVIMKANNQNFGAHGQGLENIDQRLGGFQKSVEEIYETDERIVDQQDAAHKLIRGADEILRDIFAKIEKTMKLGKGYEDSLKDIGAQIEALNKATQDAGGLDKRFEDNYQEILARIKEIKGGQKDIAGQVDRLGEILEKIKDAAPEGENNVEDEPRHIIKDKDKN